MAFHYAVLYMRGEQQYKKIASGTEAFGTVISVSRSVGGPFVSGEFWLLRSRDTALGSSFYLHKPKGATAGRKTIEA
jgi:hypothetical protein